MSKTNYDIFDKYTLKEDEIGKTITNGLLSENIYTILTYKKEDGYYHKQHLSPGYLQSIGIKVNFTQKRKYNDEYVLNEESFYITDFYLICCGRKLVDDLIFVKKSGNTETVYTRPDSIKVIPLNKLEHIKVEFDKNIKGAYAAVTKEVQKNPVKGAAIGAIVAGSTGAVVGAAMSSGTKTKTISPAGSYNYDRYTLRIKLVGGEEYIFKEFQEVDIKDGEKPNPYEEQVILANELIKQSKKKTTIEEKRQIVSDTISKGKSIAKEENVYTAIAGIIILAVIIGLVLIFQSFC